MLEEAMALAEQHVSAWRKHGSSSLSAVHASTVFDAAVRTVLTRHHCAPVFPSFAVFVDAALDDHPRPPPPDDQDDEDDATHTIRLLRQQGDAR
jgi:hypothetical protein